MFFSIFAQTNKPRTLIIFSAKNIHKSYAKHIALQDVSISVEKGKIFGLLGPNGAGKTSLLRIINRITAPDSGECFFNERIMTTDDLNRIGYLPEERGLYKKMKTGEQAMYLAQLRGLSSREAKTQIKIWFDKLDIGSWWNKKIEDLSKGMQQKVQFAITVLHKPDLLILDEPFSGFDPINASLIKNEILELKNNGTSVVFSTHNMSSVEELCDDIALINQSRNILSGNVKEIRSRYKTNTYAIKFKGNVIQFTNALWTGAKIIDKQTEDDVHTFHIELLFNNTLNGVLQAILPVVEIISVSEIVPSMNDIFIKAVGESEGKIIENIQTNLTE